MQLEELIEILDTSLEFELYADGDRVGIFSVDDKGLKEYFHKEICELTIEHNRISINLG